MTDTYGESQRRPLSALQSEYLFDGSFDRIILTRIVDGDLVEILDLTPLPFPETIASDADMVPPSGYCYFRANQNTSSIYVNPDDIPDESEGVSYLEARFVNAFIRAVSDSTANQDALKANDKNASSGIKIMRVTRADISEQTEAQALADALKVEFEKIPITVSCQTYQDGLESGQTITYTSEIDNQQFEITFTSVERRLKGGEWIFNVQLQYVVLKTPAERAREVIKRVIGGPIAERKTIIDLDFVE